MSDEKVSQCPSPALYRYTWPGQEEKLACFIHAHQLGAIAEAMGFGLQIVMLNEDSICKNLRCQSNIKGGLHDQNKT